MRSSSAAVDLGAPAGSGTRARIERALERGTVALLFVFVLGAPHSIAVAQAAFGAGSALWLVRMAVARRLLVARTPVDYAFLLFLFFTVVSVATSYVPAYSLGRLRGVALGFLLYLFASNVRTLRVAWLLALLLAVSSVGNLAWTYYERYQGRGLKIVRMEPGSPLKRWRIAEGDVILAIDGRPVATLAEFDRAFEEGDPTGAATIRYGRGEGELEAGYRRRRVLTAPGEGPERLGVAVGPGREWRARGFFSHPVTYSETLQLLASLALGWAIAASRRAPRWAVAMAVLAAAIGGALALTATRASLAAFGLSAVLMVLLRGTSRRASLAVALGLVVIVGAGTATILRDRAVGYVDLQDQSTTWRLTVWREGLDLFARHPLLGIGPDAAHEKWREWGLFANGTLPPGHWHSTPLQILVDRGIFAFLAWVALVAGFVVSVGRLARERAAAETTEGGDWRVTATVLGAWGATVGFLASSLVHFNWGDSEVVEIVWALMGISFAVWRLTGARGADACRHAEAS